MIGLQLGSKALEDAIGEETDWQIRSGDRAAQLEFVRAEEASVVVRDGRVVGQVLRELGELCFAATRHAPFVGELDQPARRLERRQGPPGAAEVGLVLGNTHGKLMRRARDTARHLIWVAADRLGAPAEARALIPMMAAGREGVEGRVLYSRSVSPLSKDDVADLAFPRRNRTSCFRRWTRPCCMGSSCCGMTMTP